MTTYVKISFDVYNGTGTNWETSNDVFVNIRRPRNLTGMDEKQWAKLTGMGIGESIARELEKKVEDIAK